MPPRNDSEFFTEDEREHYLPSVQNDEWNTLKKMLAEIPRGIRPLSADKTQDLANFDHKPRAFAKDEAWQQCADAMTRHDTQLCKGYREEIDTLLVFAGLFSAVVTGFTVESYQWLQGDSNDAVVELLLQMSQSAGVNSTAAAAAHASSGMPRSVALRINVFWFLSLCLSLGTALVAILGKQWIREFERHGPLTPRETVGVRQVKLEGLEFWKVGPIISALPLLLQLSLGLFAVGVLDLLMHLHRALAIAVSVPTLLVLLLYAATTVLPLIQYSRRWNVGLRLPQCAYKSPQAFLALQTYDAVSRAWNFFNLPSLSVARCLEALGIDDYSIPFIDGDQDVWGTVRSWNDWDFGFRQFELYYPLEYLPDSDFRGLRWLCDSIHRGGVLEAVWNCLWEEARFPEEPHNASKFTRSEVEVEMHLSMNLLHVSAAEHELGGERTYASPSACALLLLPRTDLSMDVISECLVRTFHPDTDLATARTIFRRLRYHISRDPDIVASLVSAMSAWCEQHIRDPICFMVIHAYLAVENCVDMETKSALRWCVVALLLNWLRSRDTEFRPHRDTGYVTRGLLRAVWSQLSRDTEEFTRLPDRLSDLAHVKELTALLAVYCDLDDLVLGWPLPSPTDKRIQDVLSWLHVSDECRGRAGRVVLELLRLSVCGIDNGTNGGARLLGGPTLLREAGFASDIPEHAPPTAPRPEITALAAVHDLSAETTDEPRSLLPVQVIETAVMPPGTEQTGDTISGAPGENLAAALDELAVPASSQSGQHSALSLRPTSSTSTAGIQPGAQLEDEML